VGAGADGREQPGKVHVVTDANVLFWTVMTQLNKTKRNETTKRSCGACPSATLPYPY
jgi:hypothetical protein